MLKILHKKTGSCRFSAFQDSLLDQDQRMGEDVFVSSHHNPIRSGTIRGRIRCGPAGNTPDLIV